MRYLVVGPTIVNDIVFTDGRKINGCLGGSVFCLAGFKLWCDDCLYVSNVGTDFDAYYGRWMDDNDCARNGLNPILPHTQYTRLLYGPQGLHSEESIYGPEEDELVARLDRPDPRRIAGLCNRHTRGIYVEVRESDDFWEHLPEIRQIGDIAVMWEPPTSAAMEAPRRAQTLETIRKAGLYSINLPEAMALFQAPNEDAALRALLAFGVPCYFHVGAKGSYMLMYGCAHFAPGAAGAPVVDATGCGNCATAAALYGFCEGRPPKEIAAMGNVAASFNLRQYGPYPKVTPEIRAQAWTLVKDLLRNGIPVQ